ncbi:cupin domain-containing protein [Haloferula helveola]
MLPTVKRLPPKPSCPDGEVAFPLVETAGLTLECLVSQGAASPDGFWYDQGRPEWVMLLKGSATLVFEEGVLELSTGDSLTIPPGMRHRVGEVSDDAVWLALHYEPDSA